MKANEIFYIYGLKFRSNLRILFLKEQFLFVIFYESFSWSILLGSGLIFFAHIIPVVVLVILMGLKRAIACIQAYVFTILSCIYLNDALNLH